MLLLVQELDFAVRLALVLSVSLMTQGQSPLCLSLVLQVGPPTTHPFTATLVYRSHELSSLKRPPSSIP